MEPDHGRGPRPLLTSLIFVLAIRRGVGGVPRRIELIMIAVAGGGAIGWVLADQPIVATACVVAADLIGAAMMVPKTHRDPESETLVTFALARASAARSQPAPSAPSTPRCCSTRPTTASSTARSRMLVHQRRRTLHRTTPLTAPAA